jgi:hypothetical protein
VDLKEIIFFWAKLLFYSLKYTPVSNLTHGIQKVSI